MHRHHIMLKVFAVGYMICDRLFLNTQTRLVPEHAGPDLIVGADKLISRQHEQTRGRGMT